MIVGIYARKSTEQNGVGDEEKSVTRQIEHAKAYAARKGWTVAEEHVYVDDGISGAEFVKRPGFLRLMNALKPRPGFQVLIMSEESRLGREMTETLYAMKQLMTAGVRIFLYLEDRERTLDSPIEKIMMALTSFADEMERVRARQRTHDKMTDKAKAGHVTGGRTYGYRNVDVFSPDVPGQERRKRAYVIRQVNEEEAVIVRRIFELYAAGKGFIAIAKALNDQGVPAPRSSAGQKRTWAPSCVRVILHHDLYRGLITWNRSRKRDRMGIRHQTRRPESEWLHVPAPALRIVSDAQWEAAHQRLQTARQTYLRSHRGHLWGRPGNGIESKYLLTGLGQCGLCGASMVVTSRAHGKQRHFEYICGHFYRRGGAACTNNLRLPMLATDRAILEFFEAQLLSPKVIAAAVSKAIVQLTPSEATVSEQRRELTAKKAGLEDELARLAAAVATGGDVPSLLSAIKEREAQRNHAQVGLAQLDAVGQLGQVDRKRLERDLQDRLKDWQGLVARQVSQARQLLRKLLVGMIRFDPKTIDGARIYEFSGTATLEKILAGTIPINSVGVPNGI